MFSRSLLTAVFSAVVFSSASAQTPTLTTLAQFEGVSPATTLGNGPRSGLIFGTDGLLYGSTEFGGSGTGKGNGGLFKIDSNGIFTALAQFDGTNTGKQPIGRLVLASDGNFYGTTYLGGPDNLGTLFQLTPAGTLTTVYTFATLTKKNTGSTPTDGLVEGADGYLYGTTTKDGFNGYGTIFKILPGTSGTPIRLVDFTGDGGTKSGINPSALMRASDGNFYGVTEGGGLYSYGTVFRFTPAGVFTTIANFGSVTGIYSGPVSPRAPLIQAKSGVLYGTSAGGGKNGHGTVFSVTTSGTYAALVNFTGDGGSYPGDTPEAALIQATDGYLYGTTRLGGTTTSKRGTVFRVSTAGTFATLIAFTGGSPNYGAEPRAGLAQDNEGHLFGTTSTGGTNGVGTVFSLDNVIPDKPAVTTLGLSTLPGDPNGGTRATLTGSINPQGTTALYHFEYGTTTNYGSRIPVLASSDPSAGNGRAAVTVKLSISGLTPSTVYHYRLVSSNGGGTSWGGDQTFTTGPNPNIVTPPGDQLVGVGSAAQFDVSAIGASLGYAWLKSGSTTVLGTAATYRIASATLAHAGSYSVRVNDGADVVTTSSGRLGVINRADSSQIVNEGQSITLTLPSGGPGLTFQWKTAAGDVVNDAHFSGAQTTALKISDANATHTNTYFCVVTLGTLTLTSGNFNVTTRLIPVMNMPMLGPWTVNGQAFGSISAQNSPTSFSTVPALLPPGVTLNKTTGALTGRPTAPGVYTAQFTATNAAGTSAPLNYAITVLAAQANESGSYAGITARDGTANAGTGGGVSFTITGTGAGSGKLTHLGKVFTFTTALSAAPASTRTVVIAPTAGQTGFPPVAASLDTATGDITGTVNGAAFTAKRNPWTSGSPVPTAQTGRFNLALSPVSPQLGDVAFPQGCGYASVVIDSLGNVTWTGKLSDGSVLTASTILPGTNAVTLHQSLYAAGTGSAQGSVTIAANGNVSALSLDWFKAAQTGTTRSYKTGFALHTLDVAGSKYVKPGTGVPVIGLTNAQFTFSDGGLVTPIMQLCSFTSANAIVVTNPNPNGVKVTALDLNTGIFSGTFNLDTRVPAFGGILLQGSSEGLGFFNLPQSTPTPVTSAILSGKLRLAAPVP